MASQEEISHLRDIVLEEQYTAIQEHRTPDIDKIDEIGFRLIKERDLVVCFGAVAVTAQYVSDQEKPITTTEYNPDPVVGLFDGFCSYNTHSNDSEDSYDFPEKHIGYYLKSTMVDEQHFICPIECTVLRDANHDFAYDARYQDIASVVTKDNVDVVELLCSTNNVRRPSWLVSIYNGLLNKHVRPYDLFRSVQFHGYKLGPFKDWSGYLGNMDEVTITIDSSDRFMLRTADDVPTEYSWLDLTIFKKDVPSLHLPLYYYGEYIAGDRLHNPAIANADLR